RDRCSRRGSERNEKEAPACLPLSGKPNCTISLGPIRMESGLSRHTAMAQSAQWNFFMSIFNGFRFRSIAIGAVALLMAPVAAQAGQINLTITGARNADGIVRC